MTEQSTSVLTGSPRARTPGAGAVLALACSGSFVVVLDATIVSVALPAIRADLAIAPSALNWVVNAYTLAFAGFLLLGGRLSDVYGRRRMFIVGTSVFTIARLAGGLAGSAEQLLVARAVQGLGGALLMPVTLSLLTTAFVDPGRRARALGSWSAVSAIAAAAGPVVGGVLTQWGGWRLVFFVSIPIGCVAVVAAAVMLPAAEQVGVRPRLDVIGAVIATVGLLGVVFSVMRSSVSGWVCGSVLLSLVGGVVLLGLFLLHQARWARDPLVPLGIFRLHSVSSANAVMFLVGLGFFASPVLLSLYLQDVHEYSPLRAGLAYLPLGAAMYLGAQAAGRLTLAIGARRATVLFCVLGAAGLAAMAALVGVHASYTFSMMLPGLVFAFGTTASFTPITVAATTGVSGRQSGLAAGLLNTVRQTSGAVGLAALSALAASVAASGHRNSVVVGGKHARQALAQGYSAAFAASAGCLVCAAVVAAATMPRR